VIRGSCPEKNKNAKIPTFHDSFEVKSTKAKGKRQEARAKVQRQRNFSGLVN